MSITFDTIETRRVDFFTATTTASAMIRLSLVEADEFVTAMETAAVALDDLRQAYAADLERMAAMLERLRDRQPADDM